MWSNKTSHTHVTPTSTVYGTVTRTGWIPPAILSFNTPKLPPGAHRTGRKHVTPHVHSIDGEIQT